MRLEITPEPSPDERVALERALARLLEEPEEQGSAWWREGIRENLAEEAEAVTTVRSPPDRLPAGPSQRVSKARPTAARHSPTSRSASSGGIAGS
jgi:hypothetical protein